MRTAALVYLHGFRSSPASIKARELGAAVAALEPACRPALHVPLLDPRPARAMAAILDLAAGIDPATLTFVGSSLGGYYATYAAERLGARAVQNKPAIRTHEDQRPYRGHQVKQHTGAGFEVTQAYFAELAALRVARISRPERYLLLVEAGDEVLDYRQAVTFYAGAWQHVEGGGDHGFAGFASRIPLVLRFAGVR
jgi:predicted esterase YcpF (UPF0227 family)